MQLSIILSNAGQHEPLAHTIAWLQPCLGLPDNEWELIASNAAGDIPAHPNLRQIDLREAVAAKTLASTLRLAHGDYLLLLDARVRPAPDTIPTMLDYLQSHIAPGAVIGPVSEPDGTTTACDLPGILPPYAAMLRGKLINKLSFHDEALLETCPEYDLSFRIWKSRHRVDRFENLSFQRLQPVPPANSADDARRAMRDHLVLAARYLPDLFREDYVFDWTSRYRALARHQGHIEAADEGLVEARAIIAAPERLLRNPLDLPAFESLFYHQFQHNLVAAWADKLHLRRIVIAACPATLLSTWDACWTAGLGIVAIADDSPAFIGLNYRGVDIVPLDEALRYEPEAIVLASLNPAESAVWLARLEHVFSGPILRFWEPSVFIRLPNRRRAA